MTGNGRIHALHLGKKIIGLEKPIIKIKKLKRKKSAEVKGSHSLYFTVIYPGVYSKSASTASGVVNS
jgi:hypothetical protein